MTITYLKNNNVNKMQYGALDNNITFKLYDNSIHFHVKANSALLKLLNEHLLIYCYVALSYVCKTETTHVGTTPS